jgi:anti-anti-sigma factor
MIKPDLFSVRSERTGRVHRLTPVGELDIATVPVLKEAFEAAFGDGDAELIVVDLTRLEFIDSTGVRLLLEMNAACEHVDRLRVVNGSAAVVRVLDISGVRAYLPIISSADDPFAPLPTESRDDG